jgi:hypothetical protein
VSTVKYSDLLPDVLPNLAADPSDPVTERAIRRAVIEFCAGSWVWQHFMDPIDLVAGESFYDLEPPTGGDISAIMDVKCDGRSLVNKSLEWLNKEHPSWRLDREAPKWFTQTTPDQIILAKVPDISVTGGLLVTMATEPARTSTNFPRWICNSFIYNLVDGALATLMLMPDKPWTDLKNGQARLESFNTAISNARANGIAALSRAPLRTSSQH